MNKNIWKKIIFLLVFVFLFAACKKKQESNKSINHDNDEIITVETNNELGDLSSEDDDIYESDNFFGDKLEYTSKIKVDIDTTDEETSLTSWRIYDSVPAIYNWLYLHITKDNNIIKSYRIPVSTTVYTVSRDDKEGRYGWNDKFIRFSILDNLPGKFFPDGFSDDIPGTYLYDVNEDGFDEIICVSDSCKDDYPQVNLTILGFNKDKFVTYLDIDIITIDEEKGPVPVHYIQNQGFWGFRCLMDSSKYTSLYGIPSKEKKDFIWVFFTWNPNEKKYTEKRFIE
jgi:peroxiredoxin